MVRQQRAEHVVRRQRLAGSFSQGRAYGSYLGYLALDIWRQRGPGRLIEP